MLSTRNKVWNKNFRKLKAYIDEFHHLPDKKKVENRGILNWVKYNRRKIKAGKLALEKQRLFCELYSLCYLRQGVHLDTPRIPAGCQGEQWGD